jgi:Flp pilus assembly protein TadG
MSVCNNTSVRGCDDRSTTWRLGAPRRKRERGGAAVEFALVLPLFCAVLFGTIDYGWYYYQKFTLAAAVRDAVRSSVVTATTASPDPLALSKTRGAANLGSAINPLLVNFTSSYVNAVPTLSLKLEGSMTFVPLVGLVPMPKAPMKYSMTMMLEIQPP